MTAVLLDYAFLTDPDPLQASLAGAGKAPSIATLTMLVSNGTQQVVQVKSITLSLPVGANAKDLTSNASKIHSTAPAGWSVAANGGQFKLTPTTPADGKVGRDGLSFKFNDVVTNDQVGVCDLTIDEETTAGSGQQKRKLAKWPPGFNVSSLDVKPLPPVAPGTNVTLYWSGSDNATYTLKYDDKTIHVPHSGSHVIEALEQTTTFYLDVAGDQGEAAQTLQRSVSVDVLRPEIVTGSFKATPQPVDYGQPVTLHWKTANADSCTLITNHQQFKLAANSDPNKPYQVTPQVDSSYQLVAHGGQQQTDPVPLAQISFNPAKIKSFKASAATVTYGDPVTLNWDVESAVSLLLNSQHVSGTSIAKKPTHKTTYTLTATGADKKSVSAEQTVDVNVVSVSDFKVGEITKNDAMLTILFSWKAEFATKIRLEGNLQIVLDFCIISPQTMPIRFTANLDSKSNQYRLEVPSKLVAAVTKLSGSVKISCFGPSPSGVATATTDVLQTWKSRC